VQTFSVQRERKNGWEAYHYGTNNTVRLLLSSNQLFCASYANLTLTYRYRTSWCGSSSSTLLSREREREHERGVY